MNEHEQVDLKARTKQFALRMIRLYSALPKTTEAQVIGKQVLRSGTSVGAHYREASRSRSTAEFVSKIEGGLQELEENGVLDGISRRVWNPFAVGTPVVFENLCSVPVVTLRINEKEYERLALYKASTMPMLLVNVSASAKANPA